MPLCYLGTAKSQYLRADLLCYRGAMTEEGLETFTERFNRLTASMSRKQIGQLLDLTDGAVRKLQEGTTQSLKAHGAIALARRLEVSVEYLAERGPLPKLPVSKLERSLHAMNERERGELTGIRNLALTEPPLVLQPLWAELRRLDRKIDNMAESIAETAVRRARALIETQASASTQRGQVPTESPASRGRKAR
jgi:hypothetical protein